MLSRCFLDFSVGVGGFCHRTESDLFLFLLNYISKVIIQRMGQNCIRRRGRNTLIPSLGGQFNKKNLLNLEHNLLN